MGRSDTQTQIRWCFYWWFYSQSTFCKINGRLNRTFLQKRICLQMQLRLGQDCIGTGVEAGDDAPDVRETHEDNIRATLRMA